MAHLFPIRTQKSYSSSHPIGQGMVTWSHLIERMYGKCSFYFEWSMLKKEQRTPELAFMYDVLHFWPGGFPGSRPRRDWPIIVSLIPWATGSSPSQGSVPKVWAFRDRTKLSNNFLFYVDHIQAKCVWSFHINVLFWKRQVGERDLPSPANPQMAKIAKTGPGWNSMHFHVGGGGPSTGPSCLLSQKHYQRAGLEAELMWDAGITGNSLIHRAT